MSNSPGAHRDLTQEPSPPPLPPPYRRRVIPGYSSRWQSRWCSYEELLPSPGNDHPSPSDPSRARAGIGCPGLACPVRSVSGTRRRAQHSIRELLTLRARHAFWKMNRLGFVTEMQSGVVPDGPRKPTDITFVALQFFPRHGLSCRTVNECIDELSRARDVWPWWISLSVRALLDTILVLYNLPYRRKRNRVFPNFPD